MSAEPRQDLEAGELLELVRALGPSHADAADDGLDREGPRAYRELFRDDHTSAWLISWGSTADTGFHDHDVSAGAVYVLHGFVEEERPLLGGGSSVRRFGPGEAFAFDASVIHRVCHTGAETALTLHAYSPPLWRMGAYTVEPSGALRRRSMSYAEELRPLSPAPA